MLWLSIYLSISEAADLASGDGEEQGRPIPWVVQGAKRQALEPEDVPPSKAQAIAAEVFQLDLAARERHERIAPLVSVVDPMSARLHLDRPDRESRRGVH